MCPKCKEKLDLFTDNIANQIFSSDVSHPTIGSDYVNMFETITSHRLEDVNDRPSELKPHVVARSQTIEVDGKEFNLPATLCRFIDRIGEWTHLLGKLWLAPVDLGEGRLAQFIYMENGGSVPEHTHKGSECTLVIDGAFEDGLSDYDSGDYILLDRSHTHAPQSDKGCLVFNLIDQPLYFTNGWAKLINPLSHLYFNANSTFRG